MKALIPFLLAACACAQNSDKLEIRGTVVEGAAGIGGVTVTLYEFGHIPPLATTRTVFATTSTDSQGAFTFHPERPGEYYVEVRKEGYFAESFDGPTVDPVETTGEPISIDQDHPVRERRLSLMRLGEIRGRVLDEDGHPMRVAVVAQTSSSSPQRVFGRAFTDPDGYFVVSKLRPGNYTVGIPGKAPEVVAQFSTKDFEIVDQSLDTGDDRNAPPLPVSGGVSLSAGTLTARKRSYYRAHVLVQSGDCAPGEVWSFSTTDTAPGFGLRVPCGKEFLVRNLSSGSYNFALSPSRRQPEKQQWAGAPVEVTDRNVEVTLVMWTEADISGRIVAADGAAPPPLNLTVALPFGTRGESQAKPDPAGRFTLRGMPGKRQRVRVAGPGGKFYVKEIRFNGLDASDGIITPVAGPMDLEIVIDDKAAHIGGSVAGRAQSSGRVMVVAMKWPVPPEDTSLSTLLRANSIATDDQGRFQIGGLAPGEYRVLALTDDALVRNAGNLVPMASRAETVILERGDSKSIALKLIDP